MLGPSASRYAPNISASVAKASDATSRAGWLLFLLICSVFAVRARLIFTLNVNWDEFYYLSKIYSHQRGDLASQLQTFQVHLFGWLTGLGGDEVDQIVIARAVMLALSAIACLLIYRIARLHFSSTVSLLCVLCYVAFAEVLRHGASFRADPLYAPFVLAAVYAVMRPSRSLLAPAIGGASLAVALMITIKTALFLPVIGMLLLVRLIRAGFTVESMRPAFTLGSVLLVAFAAMFALHDLLLPKLTAETDVALVRESYDRTIMHGELLPRWRWAVLSLTDSVLPWSLAIFGIAMALRRVILRKGRVPLRDLDIICLSLPLATLLLYRNAFPYFYVLVLGLAVIASGVTLDWLTVPLGDTKNRAAAYSLCGVLLAGFFLLGSGRYIDDQTRGERALLTAVHHMFPEPVPYIDRCSMVASFPKVGFFMSSWGLGVYRAAGRPVMRTLLETRQPPLLITNSKALDISGTYEDSGASEAYRLLREDFEVLKANFIVHWGPVFVAGKSVSFDRDSPSRTIEILIAGTYTVEGSAAVIDGTPAPVGSKVKLKKGRHTMRAVATPATVVLRWGADLYRPEGEPPSSIFTGL